MINILKPKTTPGNYGIPTSYGMIRALQEAKKHIDGELENPNSIEQLYKARTLKYKPGFGGRSVAVGVIGNLLDGKTPEQIAADIYKKLM